MASSKTTSSLSIPEQREVASFLVSTLHALWAVAVSAWLWFFMIEWGPTPLDHTLAVGYARFVGIVFATFLLADFLHMLRWPEQLKGGLIAYSLHHFCFIVAVGLMLSGDVALLPHMFPLFYLGELSTVFLNARFFFTRFGLKESWQYEAANAGFALSFIGVRVFLYGYGVLGVFQNLTALRANLSVAQQAVFLGLLPAGWLLNLYWSRLVFLKVWRRLVA